LELLQLQRTSTLLLSLQALCTRGQASEARAGSL
jgi:hypothetical protein